MPKYVILATLTLWFNFSIAQFSDSDVLSLSAAKSDMLEHMNGFAALIESSAESDAQSADALSQIAGEWVIHLTYSVTLVQTYNATADYCGRSVGAIIAPRLQRVMEAARSSVASVHMLMTYTEEPELLRMAERFAEDLQQLEQRYRHISSRLAPGE